MKTSIDVMDLFIVWEKKMRLAALSRPLDLVSLGTATARSTTSSQKETVEKS